MPLLSVVLALSLAQAPVTLDTFQLAGKSVQAVLPVGPPPTYFKTEDFEGWSYATRRDDSIFDRHLGKGGWDELKQLWDARNAPVAEWRAKFVIFAYSDILDHGKDGVLRERRSGFFGADRLAALQEIALFGSMVEAYSGGKLKFVPEVQIEEQAMRFDSPQQMPFGEDFAKRYFTPRLNAGGYEPDDKVFRGPYNSIFFLHDGLADTRVNTSVYGMPVTGLPFYSDYDSDNRGQLARRMFNAWYGHLVDAMSRHGYQVGTVTKPLDDRWTSDPMRLRLPQGLVSDSMWPVLANLKDTNDYGSHWPVKGATAQPSEKVEQSPWTLLPHYSAGDILDGASKDIAETTLTQRGGRAIEPEFDSYEVQSDGRSGSSLGFIVTTCGPKIALEGSISGLYHGGPWPAPSDMDFETGDPHTPVSGYFSYKLVDDKERRSTVGLIEENWVSRTGWMRLINGNGSPENVRQKFVDILLKQGFGAHSIEVVGNDKTVRYSIFSSNPTPAESNGQQPIPLTLKDDGSWQHVVLDVSGVGPLVGVYLTPGNGRYWSVDLDKKPSIYIDYARMSPSAQPTPTKNIALAADQSSSDPDARALHAVQTTAENYSVRKQSILKMLADESAEVAMNAANVYTRFKDKAAIDPLIGLSKNADPRIAEAAIQALKYQGTPTAQIALNTALAQGTFEANRFYAALTLADEKDPSLAESYSLLIDSKNRETRLAAVRALAAMPGEAPRKFMLAMLLDTDPEVEATVAQLGDPTFEDFEKRMQWYSINDASDWVRAQCNIAMIKSSLPGFAAEGFKGISDDSYLVRILVLQYLEEHPTEAARPAILSAFADKNEEVRAQALKSLASLQTPANLKELDNVGMDTDPRVQLALIDLAKKQKLKLSQPILDQLRKSVDPQVLSRLTD
ncbi:MAG TPA: HEAT repeat domain-containing protein [Fimbriimonadaceae bacterium]|jgi:HEAT repeat protein